MHQRVIVGTKLAETLARGVFVLVCTYALPVVDAGQFGLTVLGVSLLAFALNYEKQVDMLRLYAGRSTAAVRAGMADAMRFYAVHAAWLLPTTFLAAMLATPWSTATVAMMLLVAVAELTTNHGYHLTLLDRRNYLLLALSAAKYGALATHVAVSSMLRVELFSFHDVLVAWSIASALHLLLAAAFIRTSIKAAQAVPADSAPRRSVLEQYRASSHHLAIGLVAVVALQADRLVVGGTLTAFDVGVYFRNVTLAGLALQVFNIVSFNRVAPGVYTHAREGDRADALRVVGVELTRFSVALVVVAAIGLAVGLLHPSQPLAAMHIEPLFVGLLVTGVLLRAAADYAGLLLLAFGADTALLRNQLVGVASGVAALAVATWRFGLPGAVAGALVTPLVYLLFNCAAVRRLA